QYPGLLPGRPGAGMIHRIIWRVTGPAALDFWTDRLTGAGYEAARVDDALRFADFEGLEHELQIVQTTDEPLIAEHPEIPAELALQGFHAVHAYASDPGRSRSLLEETLGFAAQDDSSYEVRGDRRGGLYFYDAPPAE